MIKHVSTRPAVHCLSKLLNEFLLENIHAVHKVEIMKLSILERTSPMKKAFSCEIHT